LPLYNQSIESPIKGKVLTVTQVNQLVSGMLDQFFSDILVEGEASNVKYYPSGHIYFTLKDETSQISAVCFKSVAQRLKFKVTDGLKLAGRGRLDVYVQSGRYQLILNEIEPKGQGALQLAFEQLKKKLAGEGLFEEARKKPIPLLPRAVGIVTSPSGAAIHDMLRTLRLHGAKVKVLLCPVAVQGDGAAAQIAEAIGFLNARDDIDVIISGRGGGSIEDLWPFNEEIVARAIAASRIPVISAVGHEVDFTIADFVADMRAATPTAAAQLVARGWEELSRRLGEYHEGLQVTMEQMLADREQQLESLIQRVRHEVMDLRFRATARVRTLADRIADRVRATFRDRQAGFQAAAARLDILSPLASLQRGYAICRKTDGTMVTRTEQVASGENISVRVTDGNLNCDVRDVRPEDGF
jgi:exodeoxyribonuclease VII large subunit